MLFEVLLIKYNTNIWVIIFCHFTPKGDLYKNDKIIEDYL